MNLRFAIVVAAALLTAACAHVRKKEAAPAAKPAAAAQAPAAEQQEASLRAHTYSSDPRLQTVHFAFDSSDLDAKATAILKSNAEYLNSQARAGDAILMEGYADDRGTLEFNLALGQERAAAVEKYYRMLGVPLRRMATVSYGKLKPICTQDDDACWSQNRRVETKIGSPVE